MLDVLHGELEREFDAEGIRRFATRYLGLDAEALVATSVAELAASVVEQCHLLDSLDALADAMAVERPTLARRLDQLSVTVTCAGSVCTAALPSGP